MVYYLEGVTRCPIDICKQYEIKKPRNAKEKIYKKQYKIFVSVVTKNFFAPLPEWEDLYAEFVAEYWRILDKIEFDGSHRPFKFLQINLLNVYNRRYIPQRTQFSIPQHRERNVFNKIPLTVSINSAINEDDGDTLEGLIPDERVKSPDDFLDFEYNKRLIKKLSWNLSDKEKDILHTLLDENIPKTKKEKLIANRYNITIQRTNQIKFNIFRRMRAMAKRKGYRYYDKEIK